jgi:hypothetical protein
MFQFGGLSFELANQSMALYAEEVMPKLRATTAALSHWHNWVEHTRIDRGVHL